MSISKIKCPKCKKIIPKTLLKKTHGKCNKCGFNLTTTFIKFTTARSRIKSKYGR